MNFSLTYIVKKGNNHGKEKGTSQEREARNASQRNEERAHERAQRKEEVMDKKIRSIQREVKKDAHKEEKGLSQLAKMDKNRDKVCDLGKKMMKKGKK